MKLIISRLAQSINHGTGWAGTTYSWAFSTCSTHDGCEVELTGDDLDSVGPQSRNAAFLPFMNTNYHCDYCVATIIAMKILLLLCSVWDAGGLQKFCCCYHFGHYMRLQVQFVVVVIVVPSLLTFQYFCFETSTYSPTRATTSCT